VPLRVAARHVCVFDRVLGTLSSGSDVRLRQWIFALV